MAETKATQVLSDFSRDISDIQNGNFQILKTIEKAEEKILLRTEEALTPSDYVQSLCQNKNSETLQESTFLGRWVGRAVKGLIEYAIPGVTIINYLRDDGIELERKSEERLTAGYNKTLSDSKEGALLRYADIDLPILETMFESIDKETNDYFVAMREVFKHRNIIRAFQNQNGIFFGDELNREFNDSILPGSKGKNDKYLNETLVTLVGERNAIEELIKKNKETSPRQPEAREVRTPSSLLQPEHNINAIIPVKDNSETTKLPVKSVDFSSHEKMANVIDNKTIPAVDSLQTALTTNSLELGNQQLIVDDLSETYSGYISALTSTAESMNYLTLIEDNLAQKQSVTSEILNNELGLAQQRVDTLAGDSLVQLSNAFAGAIVRGESFGEALKSIGENILYTILQMQMLNWLTSLFGSGGGGSANGFTLIGSSRILNGYSPSPYGAWGSAISMLIPGFAKGGIVNQPTLFGFAKGVGLMGEAGPEAIMPLGRDSRGNLGVRMAEGGANGGDTFISNFNVEVVVENSGGGDMTDDQARALGAQINAAVEMKVAKQMYEYARSGVLRAGAGRAY